MVMIVITMLLYLMLTLMLIVQQQLRVCIKGTVSALPHCIVLCNVGRGCYAQTQTQHSCMGIIAPSAQHAAIRI